MKRVIILLMLAAPLVAMESHDIVNDEALKVHADSKKEIAKNIQNLMVRYKSDMMNRDLSLQERSEARMRFEALTNHPDAPKPPKLVYTGSRGGGCLSHEMVAPY